MNISLIINTCALDPRAGATRNPWRSSLHRERAEILCSKVIPRALAQNFHEVIIAGNWEEGEGYRYVPIPPIHRDRRDALIQREVGARYSTGDVLIFGHDDHMLAENFAKVLESHSPEWDILVPKRIHGITGETLNNGRTDNYMGGHILVMRREVWAETPWTSVDTEFWDTSLTRIWREAGAEIVWTEDLVHIDVEAKEGEE